MNEEKKSYYAIIPADVRYDPDLTPNAKLLYGEITALTNEKGYCWATNNYFAKLYNTTPISISRWIKALKDKGYITTETIREDGINKIDKRYIQICKGGLNKIVKGGINKIVKENNTYNNNKKEYIYKKDLPEWFNKDLEIVKPTEEERKEIDSLLEQFM